MTLEFCTITEEREVRQKMRELIEGGVRSWVEYDPHDRVFWLFWSQEGAQKRGATQ